MPRHLLEDLASVAFESDSAGLVSQVFDQYLNYVSLEPNLFSLQLRQSYYLLNNPSTTETQIDTLVSSIASSLFSVLITLGNDISIEK